MSKKAICLLFCLSTFSFANTPIRHRTVEPRPDLLVVQSAAQSRLAEVLEPLSVAVETQTDDALAATTLADHGVLRGIASDLITAAKRHIGARYSSGCSGPKAFDCSGFTSYVFARMGITLKRSSREQVTQGEAVRRRTDLQPGDLVFFGRGGRGVNHVGIVTDVEADGTFQFIHASTSRGVRIDSSSDSYWTRRYVSARRILGTEV
ncbi:MAG: C40 family peptidase [Bacteroidaceae bacterium]|jgi:cell wall-associated NlpC family hydrolase|nr:C40 family peptidase [Bacteroidaceae bacterium]